MKHIQIIFMVIAIAATGLIFMHRQAIMQYYGLERITEVDNVKIQGVVAQNVRTKASNWNNKIPQQKTSAIQNYKQERTASGKATIPSIPQARTKQSQKENQPAT